MRGRVPIQNLLDRIKTNWPEAAAPETDIMFSVIRFHELIRMRTDEALKSFNLTHAAFEVLVALRAQPTPRQLTPTELGRSVLLSTGGTTKILIGLERRGLIERIENPTDARSKIVKLTQTGKRLSEQAMKDVMKHDKVHFKNIKDRKVVRRIRDTIIELIRTADG